MKIFKFIRSLFSEDSSSKEEEKIPILECKEKIGEEPFKSDGTEEVTERLLTVSQSAKKHGVTRQAIFFAIKMKRLNAKKENNTWLISESDLKDYIDHRYSRSKSRKEGQLIFDKSKGYYSITEVAKMLGKNTNHIYYLVRVGKLNSHRQGNAIVIQDIELHRYMNFIQGNTKKNMITG